MKDERSFDGSMSLSKRFASTDIAGELLTGSCDCPEVQNKGTLSAPEGHTSVNGLGKSVDMVLEDGELFEWMMYEHSFDDLVNLPKSLESADIPVEWLPRSCDSSEMSQVDAESVTKNLLHGTQEPSKELMEEKLELPGVLNTIQGLEIEDSNNIFVSEERKVVDGYLPHHAIPSVVVFKEWKYPSRRSVSATRDFPPGCGTDIIASVNFLQEAAPPQWKDLNQDKVKCVKEIKSFIHDDVVLGSKMEEAPCGRSMHRMKGSGETAVHLVHPSKSSDGQCRMSEQQSNKCDRDIEEGASECRDSKGTIVYRKDKGDERRKTIYPDLPADSMVFSHHEEGIVSVQGPRQQGQESGNRQEKRTVAVKFKFKYRPHGAMKDTEKWKEESIKKVPPSMHDPGVVPGEQLERVEKVASVGRDSKEAIVYRKDRGNRKRKIFSPGNHTNFPEENMVFPTAVNRQWQLDQESGNATSSCVGATHSVQEKRTVKFKFKSKFYGPMKDTGKWKEEGVKMVSPSMQDPGVIPGEPKTPTENDSCHKHLFPIAAAQSHEVDLSLHPFGVSCSIDGGARNKVREMPRLFHALVRKLLQEKEMNPNRGRKGRIDLQALNIFKAKAKYSASGKPILGRVPGVEVGDEFHYRSEVMIVGLHRLLQAGIDYLKEGDMVIATSIVESGGYDNNVVDSDLWIYTGEGGNGTGGDKQPEDQKLVKGNLALKNSIYKKNVVRGIRGVKVINPNTTSRGRPKSSTSTIYTYYGLFTVERYWPEIGKRGKKEYKFELKRLPGQPELAWKEVKKSNKLKIREGCCVADVSERKEHFPICAVNTIDCEKPPPFTYIARMIYPDWCKPLPSRGCDCKNSCFNSTQCSCVAKNGREIPYNFDGAIVQSKPLVYECGPSCKCPPSCYNRVSQLGIRFELEIFKTPSRGWGVRSLCSIPSGSFICEYTGKLLKDKEAEERTGNDEYLFDIGQNYNDHSLWEGLKGLIPDAEPSSNEAVADAGFTIDAAQYGNVGRFINHSCSPNLYAQDVLYDHGDSRVPHIMFFAVENISPLQELTYHYNYAIGQVYDKDGNVKVKPCYCGSSDCTGRMY